MELLTENPIALVSEKLDGSNLSVSSSGLISSRRKILLKNPGIEELSKAKFAGEPLSSLEPVLKAAKAMADVVFKPLFQFFDLEITIFGEWLQTGTASSKEDKFAYAERGLEKAVMYGFGLGLTFKEPLNEAELQKVKKILVHKSFAPSVVKNDQLVLLLNGEVKHLFNRFKIPTVPILQTLPFVKIFEKMADDLLQHKVEGFVITIPSKGFILKWKGHEDNDPRRVGSLLDIANQCKVHSAIGPLNQVLQESLLFNAHGRKRYFDPNLANAFNSARSKFPRLDDITQDLSDPQVKAKIIEGYKFTIIDEITKDFAAAFGCTKETIEAFVNHEVKP